MPGHEIGEGDLIVVADEAVEQLAVGGDLRR
jgi:hypothetical protein